MAQTLCFTKMQGCGNDYVYVNGFEEHITLPIEHIQIFYNVLRVRFPATQMLLKKLLCYLLLNKKRCLFMLYSHLSFSFVRPLIRSLSLGVLTLTS